VTASADLRSIIEVLARQRGVDLSDQRPDTLARGVGARLEKTRLDARAYCERIEGDDGEVTRLIDAILVPATTFFRDPPVWEALAAEVLPALASGRSRPLRVWSAGCATGEEAWSIAMLLAEAFPPPWGFDVTGSDLHESSVETAMAARYPLAAVESIVSGPRVARFLESDGQSVRVVPALRETARFEVHDLMGRALAPRAAVVASFDLVLLRNVLIYFDRRLQEKAIERVAGTIAPRGALVLGPYEMLPGSAALSLRSWPGLPADLHVFRREQIA